MNPSVRLGGTLALILGLGTLTAASARPGFPFRPESRLWVEGTSTVRGFTCEAGSLQGSVDARPGVARLSLSELPGTVRGVRVSVPVETLECGNATMNDHLFKALKAQAHPAVEFHLVTYEVSARGAEEAAVRMSGRLSLAGQERPITLEGLATPAPEGALRVKGSKEIVMSEFGIKPPTLMMGTLKVHDRVRVHFDVLLKP